MVNKVEQLETEIAVASDPQEKIDLMNALAGELEFVDLQRALSLSQSAYKQASAPQFEGKSYDKGMASGLYNQARANRWVGNHALALSQSFEALTIFEANGFLKEQSQVLGVIGSIYWILGDYSEALSYVLKGLEVCETLDDKIGQAIALENTGNIYHRTGDLPEALSAYERALKISQEVEGHSRAKASMLNNLALVHSDLENFSEALTYGHESLNLIEQIGDKVLEANVSDTMGTVYMAMADYRQALAYLQRSLRAARETGDKNSEALALINVGKVHYRLENNDEAVVQLYEALTMAEDLDAKSLLYQCHRVLATISEQQGQWQKALNHHKQYQTMREAVFNEEADNKLKNLQILHNTETAQKEAEIYRLKNEELEAEITERKRIEADLQSTNEELAQTLSHLRATQKQLVEAEKMASLGSLVAGVAHEINTPIGIGVTAASTLEDETNLFTEAYRSGRLKRSVLDSYMQAATESSQLILSNLHRAAELVQSFKQVAVDQTNLDKRRFVVKDYLEEVLRSLEPQLRRARHHVDITGDEKLQLDSYPGAFSQVITNLVMNSMSHAYCEGEAGQLRINICQQDNNYLVLEYVDDGCGISEENLGKIFEPFFTTSRNQGGTGLGLHIVYNLVTQKLGGRIRVESEIGNGTRFIIDLPITVKLEEL